jgi:hypothetical protein
MRLRARRWCTLVAGAFLAPGVAGAQARDAWLQKGIVAYEQLDYAVAVALFRRQLVAEAPGAGGAESDSARTTTLMYLGASELFGGRQDSAVAAFRRLVLLEPGFQPNPLTFPPEVTDLFHHVRRDTRAVALKADRTTDIAVGRDRFTARLVASAYQTVEVAIALENGSPVRVLYTGPIGDTLPVTWDGRDAVGTIVAAGAYWLRVNARAPSGESVRFLQLPLTVRRLERDTLPFPPPPADSLLRPERREAGPALGALATGALVSGAVVVLPSLTAGGASPTPARFVVAGAVSLSGVTAFLLRRPGRVIPENVRANEAVRDAWRRQVEFVKRANAERRREVRLVIDTGTPHVIAADAP